jgi:hypothetical protein
MWIAREGKDCAFWMILQWQSDSRAARQADQHRNFPLSWQTNKLYSLADEI